MKGVEGEESGLGGKVKEVSTSMASGEEGACSNYIVTMMSTYVGSIPVPHVPHLTNREHFEAAQNPIYVPSATKDRYSVYSRHGQPVVQATTLCKD